MSDDEETEVTLHVPANVIDNCLKVFNFGSRAAAEEYLMMVVDSLIENYSNEYAADPIIYWPSIHTQALFVVLMNKLLERKQQQTVLADVKFFEDSRHTWQLTKTETELLDVLHPFLTTSFFRMRVEVYLAFLRDFSGCVSQEVLVLLQRLLLRLAQGPPQTLNLSAAAGAEDNAFKNLVSFAHSMLKDVLMHASNKTASKMPSRLEFIAKELGKIIDSTKQTAASAPAPPAAKEKLATSQAETAVLAAAAPAAAK